MSQRFRPALIILFALTLLGSNGPSRPSLLNFMTREKYELISSRTVRTGLTYYYIANKRGPWRIHVLEIDLHQTDLDISAARALDRMFGRETTSSIASRHETTDRTVVAALNADFFDLTTGEIENNNVIDEVYVKGTKMTESPHDIFDNIHTQFGISTDRRPLLDRLQFTGKVIWGKGTALDLHGVNDVPQSNSLILYNHYYGSSTPTDTVRMAIRELSLREIRRNHDTSYTVVTGKANSGASGIGEGTAVLSGYDLLDPSVMTTANIGDTIRFWLGMNPNRGTLRTLVGGWPRIVLDGANIGGSADQSEGTFPSFSAQRNPRSGIGFSRDSSTVYFLAIDGRQQKSAGVTLTEFAEVMISLGIYQGLNLDGGGSTTFVLEGKVMNTPSDPTGERPIGNCLLLTAPKQR